MMNLSEIEKDVENVIAYSQGLPKPLEGIHEIISNWYEAKKDLISLFNGDLIYEFPEPVSFEIGDAERITKVGEFCDRVSSSWDNDDLANFIYLVKNDFYSNILSNDYVCDGYNIKKGSKIIKAFKFFEPNKEKLTAIQNEASMLIQEDKVTGTLCFSVHPLDFLSSSENNYRWRSCHALDGDYRAGNLSYMMDKCTFMCYLRGEKEAKIPNFPEEIPWTNKKWRMLFFVNEGYDMIFAGRQYPFFSSSALEIVKESFTKLVRANDSPYSRYTTWSNFQLKEVQEENEFMSHLITPYILVRSRLYPMDNIVMDADYSRHFNDLLRSSYYTPYYAYNLCHGPKVIDNNPFVIGGACKCVKCGERNNFTPESMLCEECEFEFGQLETDNIVYCECCGRKVWVEDCSYIQGSDSYYCDDCVDSLATRCECCGELYFNDEVRYDDTYHEMRCESCHSDRKADAFIIGTQIY